jgi:hypothetical protein
MSQTFADSLRIMRLAIGRRNVNDSDSDDTTLMQYISDFVNLTMTNDVKIFEQFGTLEFSIDETNTTGVYTFSEVQDQGGILFSNISAEGFITLSDPPSGSVSWNRLAIYQDPGIFYDKWGVNNTDVLIAGYPTEMLYYGDEFVFRTIPDTSYNVIIYGYKIVDEQDSTSNSLPHDYWMRYIAYGAAANYARDYRYEQGSLSAIEKSYARERKLLLTRTHNQIKQSRALPRF